MLIVDTRSWPSGQGPSPDTLWRDAASLLAVSFGIVSSFEVEQLITIIDGFIELDDPASGVHGVVSLNGRAAFTRRETLDDAERLSVMLPELYRIVTEGGWPVSGTETARSLGSALELYAESLAGLSFELPEIGRGRPKSPARKAVVRIAAEWPALTGESPTVWRDAYEGAASGRFYAFVRAVLALNEKKPPSASAIKGWLDKELKTASSE